MPIQLAYGRRGLEVDLPAHRTTVISPHPTPALPNEHHAVIQALDHPIHTPPLRELCPPSARICITFSDSTRATPNERLIPWLLEHLRHVPRDQITLLNQTGTHRPNSPAELDLLLTPDIARRYRVVNHEADNPGMLTAVGTLRNGTPALLNRHLVEADVRIITGFIEPHFFAGFSGGPKGIIPGCAGLPTIQSNHGPTLIRHPQATFGITHGNPLWEELLEVALRLQPAFLLNVTLNDRRQITGVFAGHLHDAHQQGTDFVRRSAMQLVPHRFEVVVTSNSGSPLDLNLYQGVKGLSAAARIVQPGGLIVLACECAEGIPENSPFHRLLRSAKSPQALLEQLLSSPHIQPEQWQTQILAQIQQQARIQLYSTLPDPSVRECHLEPCPNIPAAVNQELTRQGPHARVAVLPHGPLTIPFLPAENGSIPPDVASR